MFAKKATKIDEIFTVDLTLCSECQIDGEEYVNFCGLLRKDELYLSLECLNKRCYLLMFTNSIGQLKNCTPGVVFFCLIFYGKNCLQNHSVNP